LEKMGGNGGDKGRGGGGLEKKGGKRGGKGGEGSVKGKLEYCKEGKKRIYKYDTGDR